MTSVSASSCLQRLSNKAKYVRGGTSFERVNSKAGTLKFLKGNGNITSQNAPKELGIRSLYLDSYTGKPSPDRADNVAHYFTVSTATGACIPEQKMLTLFATRAKTYSNSIERVQNKMTETISSLKLKSVQSRELSNVKIKRNLLADA